MRNLYFEILLIRSKWASLAVELLNDREILELGESGLVEDLILGLLHLVILEVEDLPEVEGLLGIAILSE